MKMLSLTVLASGLVAAMTAPALGIDPPEPTAARPADAASPQVVAGIVKTSPKELWKVWTTPEGFKKLGVAKAEIDLRPGGLIRSHYDPAGVVGDEGTIENEILAFEPERMLAIRIHKPPKGFPFEKAWKGTWTVISMADLGDGTTHVRIVGLGYDESAESVAMREFFAKGNGWTLQRLAQQFDSSAPAPAATAHGADPMEPIRVERVVALPRERVWGLLTTSAGWKEFLGVESKIEARPGGRFEVYFGATAPEGERGSEGCRVLSVLPGEMLSFDWNAPPKLAHARARRTWVVVVLEEVSATTTRVRLVHEGFAQMAEANPDHRAEWEETRGYFANAWPKVLDAVKTVGERRAK
ncbi:MAG: SRPBCC domain-containing protein [Phycisphaerales bacterium]